MPKIGDKRYIKGRNSAQWCACVGCGKERWVILRYGKPIFLRCHECSIKRGEQSNAWSGGRYIHRGYIKVKLQSDDFFYSMTDHLGYVLEHRLIMAKHLGRNLQLWEIIHHRNGIKSDNRLENLQLVTEDRHRQITLLESRIKYLEQRVTLLEADNVLLKPQFVEE